MFYEQRRTEGQESIGAITNITKGGVMRDGWKSRWGWRVSAVVLVGGLLVLGTGNVVTQAGERDDDHNQRNPFHQILDKLDQILAATTGAAGQGNPTLRWDTNHPSATRFTTAFTGAVLDKNTGLVWEQAPAATAGNCLQKNVGGTLGWRLPSVPELASLIDPSLPAPFVPASVFTGVQSTDYWSASSNAADPTTTWSVNFSSGNASPRSNTLNSSIWCVRGGTNAAHY
jgi:hypothetical protein